MADFSQEHVAGIARQIADSYYVSCLGSRLDIAADLAGELDYPEEVRAVTLLQGVRDRTPGSQLWGQLPPVVVQGVEVAHEAYALIKEHEDLDLQALVANKLAHVAIFCSQAVDDFGPDIAAELPTFHRELHLRDRIARLPKGNVSLLPRLVENLPGPAATRNFVIDWQPNRVAS
jgi:hypothetical protein